jgi:hypothetical protein
MRGLRATLAAVAALVCFGGAAAAAQACSDSWMSPVSGSWGDGANWSTGKSPETGDDACITQPGTYTVMLAPYTPQEAAARIAGGDTVASLTIGAGAGTGTQTLDIAGQSFTDSNNELANSIGLGVSGAASIAAGGQVVLDSTASGPAGAGQTPGGSAVLGVGTLTNAGTIISQAETPNWQSFLGGTITNSGTIAVNSGTLGMPTPNNGGTGAQNSFNLTNNGTVSVAAPATLNLKGPGVGASPSTFTNNATVAAGGTVIGSSNGSGFTWAQNGGSVTGNPVHLQSGALLSDSAGAASFILDHANASVEGTIPSGQTVTLSAGASTSSSNEQVNDQALDLDGKTLINDGTLVLDATAAGGGTPAGANADLSDGTLQNHGTLIAQVDDPSWVVKLQAAVTNGAGATFDITGPVQEQSSTTNQGTVSIAASGHVEIQNGGSFANTGTIAPQIAGPTSYAQFSLDGGCCNGPGAFTAGGTIAPALVGGYAPAAGQEFQEIALDGGTFTGTFGAVTGGFRADYAKQTASPAYVGLVYGVAVKAKATSRPKAGAITTANGKLKVTLSCPHGGAGCGAATVTATVIEHLRGKKLIGIGGSAKPTPKTTSKRVVVARGSVTLAAGKSRTLTLSLNKTGKALLNRFHRAATVVTVTASKHTVKRKTVHLSAHTKHHKKK